jgi:hypothetical protein
MRHMGVRRLKKSRGGYDCIDVSPWGALGGVSRSIWCDRIPLSLLGLGSRELHSTRSPPKEWPTGGGIFELRR